METERLRFLAMGPKHWRALMDGGTAFSERFGPGLAEGLRDFLLGGELSPEFLAKLEAASGRDPWTFGFAVVQRDANLVIGMAGFKGPPADGMVEIAYGIAPGHEGRGYATESARALNNFARESGKVRFIRAHTLPERNASGQVLKKCGFRMVGEVIDPEDGPVWRWELELP